MNRRAVWWHGSKPWTASELAEMGRRLEELERPKAEEREKAGRPSGNLPEGGTKGDTRDVVGEALGVSGKTYEKAKSIAEHGVATDIAVASRT